MNIQKEIIKCVFGDDLTPNKVKVFDAKQISEKLGVSESEINIEAYKLQKAGKVAIITDLEGYSAIVTWMSLLTNRD